MEQQQKTVLPISLTRKVLLATGISLYVIMNVLIFTVDPSRDNDFWFLSLIYLFGSQMIVGFGRYRASRIARAHAVPGAVIGLGLLVYLAEAFALQPTLASIIISIGSLVVSVLARFVSTRLTRGLFLVNNAFVAGALASFLFPTLYLSHISAYHTAIDPGLIALSSGLVGLAPVYALLFESMPLKRERR